MAEQDGYSGFSPAAYGAPAPHVPLPGMPPAPMLRPLSTGEVLDRTFAMYRQRFWLFVGIGGLPAVTVLLSSIARLVYLALTHRTVTFKPGATPDALGNAMGTAVLLQVYFLPATVLFLMAYGISHAATVDAVARVSRGLPVTAASAYDNVRSHWLRWTGIILRQFWSFLWPMLPGVAILFAAIGLPSLRSRPPVLALLFLGVWCLFMAAVVYGVLNFIRNALAMPAGVQENLGVNAALRRSRMLVAGRKGRIFLALLLVYALQMVVGAIQLPLVMLATTTRGAEHIVLQALELLVQFLTVALITPIASIAFCYFYTDERVRREGFDIEIMMQRSFASSAPAQATEL